MKKSITSLGSPTLEQSYWRKSTRKPRWANGSYRPLYTQPLKKTCPCNHISLNIYPKVFVVLLLSSLWLGNHPHPFG